MCAEQRRATPKAHPKPFETFSLGQTMQVSPSLRKQTPARLVQTGFAHPPASHDDFHSPQQASRFLPTLLSPLPLYNSQTLLLAFLPAFLPACISSFPRSLALALSTPTPHPPWSTSLSPSSSSSMKLKYARFPARLCSLACSVFTPCSSGLAFSIYAPLSFTQITSQSSLHTGRIGSDQTGLGVCV